MIRVQHAVMSWTHMAFFSHVHASHLFFFFPDREEEGIVVEMLRAIKSLSFIYTPSEEVYSWLETCPLVSM